MTPDDLNEIRFSDPNAESCNFANAALTKVEQHQAQGARIYRLKKLIRYLLESRRMWQQKSVGQAAYIKQLQERINGSFWVGTE